MSQLTVDLTEDDLLNLTTDACVCTIHRSKDLNKGKLSKQISEAAGAQLQTKLRLMNRHHDLKQGQVVEAQPENLSTKFQHLYFVCLRMWQEGNDEGLQGAVERILDDAAGKKFTSIAFPPLGMGGQRYPPRKVAMAILQGIMAYSIDNPDSSVTTIKISIFGQKDEMLQTFTDILSNGVRMYDISSTQEPTTPVKDLPKVDKNDNKKQDQFSVFAQPVISTRQQPNLVQRFMSYFGRSVVVYRFNIGPSMVGVGPYVNFSQRGLGAQLTIGLTISVDALPIGVKTVLSKLFKT